MYIRNILTLTLSGALLCVSFQVQAANPAFGILFKFQPPVNAALNAPPPSVYLDVCGDPGCGSVISSIAMSCALMNTTPNSLAIESCKARAVLKRGAVADPNMAVLGNPTNLRVRMNNLMSPVFPFPGGQPSVPETLYRYRVVQGPTGFLVEQ